MALERVSEGEPQASLTRTHFVRPLVPLLIETFAFGTPKWAATRPMSSAFDLPSIGGDLISADHRPSSFRVRDDTFARGLTLT